MSPGKVLPLLLASVCGWAAAAPVRVEPAFGYRIGDSVVAVGTVAVDGQAQLDPESVPKTGRVNGWLTLNEVRVVAGSHTREVIRVFQVTASAPEPKLLFLPKAELKFTLGGRQLTERLESVPISVSPLTPAEPILRSGFGILRPDRDVPQPEAGEALRRAGWLAATLAVLALLWVALRTLAMRRRGFAPFGVAAGRLRRHARARSGSRDDPEAVRAAYRILHQAFNEAAGRPVFASRTDDFLAARPRFAAEAAAIRAFFERSEKAFFGVNREPQDMSAQPAGTRDAAQMDWLLDLARRLASLERPGR